MIFRETTLEGVWLVEPEPLSDDRGFFARTWCRREFEARGLNPALAQCSVSWTRARGTVRGLHYQARPHEEAKLVRCTRGAVHDVALDVRRGSPTFGRWIAAELSADNHRMLYVPEGVAHGFQTLADDTEVFYQISETHDPGSERGVRWDDPGCAIAWPLAPVTVSPRDAALPPLRE
ncbi:MAG: dTDP-4-dehydrorhamnose 3,5-epimerase [Candidatus Rokuibacteriota bacterium]|nr:MAG: dTDP-4-dehydrorhamnose 3,5-epimerase [Candidatus Rokubacteria bacterium]